MGYRVREIPKSNLLNAMDPDTLKKRRVQKQTTNINIVVRSEGDILKVAQTLTSVVKKCDRFGIVNVNVNGEAAVSATATGRSKSAGKTNATKVVGKSTKQTADDLALLD